MRGLLTFAIFSILASAVPQAQEVEGDGRIYELVISEARQSAASDRICNHDTPYIKKIGRPFVRGSFKYKDVDLRPDTRDEPPSYFSLELPIGAIGDPNIRGTIASYDRIEDTILSRINDEWKKGHNSNGESVFKIQGNFESGIIYFEVCQIGEYDGSYEEVIGDGVSRFYTGVYIEQSLQPESRGVSNRNTYVSSYFKRVPIVWELAGNGYSEGSEENECPFDAQTIAEASPNLLAEFAAEHPPCYEPVRERVCAEVIADYEALIDYGPQPAFIELPYRACLAGGDGTASASPDEAGFSLETPIDTYLLQAKEWWRDRMVEGAVGSEGLERYTLALAIGLTEIVAPESGAEIAIGAGVGAAAGAVIRIGARYVDDAFITLKRIWRDESGSVPLTSIKPNLNLGHIFHGEVRRGRLTGFHYRDLINPTSGARVVRRGPSDINGSYRAEVEIDINGILYKKGDLNDLDTGRTHTMFSDSWSRSRVEKEIYEAFNSDVVAINRNRWEGISSSGVRIRGYLDNYGDIITAFPIIE